MSRRRFSAFRKALMAATAVVVAATGVGVIGAGTATAAAWDSDWAAAAYSASPASVTASGSENAGVAPGNAVDGNAATRWSSNFADDAWIRIDLGTSIRITEVRLAWEAAYGRRYVLESSTDGATWKTFFTENAGTGGTVAAHTYPQEVVGRYVRMRGLQRATVWGYSLFSFQVLGGQPAPASTARANLALFHPAYGDYYQHSGQSPAFATDGGIPANLTDDTTRWSSDWNQSRWISVDLGAVSTINSVDLWWQAAYAVNYNLQVSNDNQSWRTVYQPSAAQVSSRRANVLSPTTATGLHDVINLSTPATGRYVRMQGTERRSFYNPAPYTAQFGYSLYEFQVWGTGGSAAAAYPALPTESAGAYRTTFNDDFNGSALDRGKWRVVRTGATMNSVNGESQAYVDSTQNVSVGGGLLSLTPRYCRGCTTAPNGQVFDFSSGRIDTNTHFDFTYGRVSARMRLPVGDGFWPAFWLLGSNVDDPSVSWPASGETDIMENIGYVDWTSAALHGPGYSGDGNVGLIQHFPAGGRIDQWHTYAVEWTPDAARFSVDGVQFFEVLRSKVESTRGQWVYGHNFYVILNLALGGAYPAGWNKATVPYWGLPQSTVDKIAAGGVRVDVDWVRVEQRA